MKKSVIRTAAVVILAVIGLAAVVYGYSPQHESKAAVEGWIEGKFIFVSADEAGRVETLLVREGDGVSTGAALFSLDEDLQQAALAEAEAAFLNARITFDRAKELLEKRVGSQKSRDDAEATLRTAEARVNSARTRLKRRSVASPVSGVVQEVYFRVGEMVQSGRPIVSLLPPGNIRARFFVPQAMLPLLRIDDRVSIRCDGCSPELTARISFISAEAEFTPPIIYSPQERSRLVFRVEALPDQPAALRVGQPVTVLLATAGSASDAAR
jgi:HlyD family secretion protein